MPDRTTLALVACASAVLLLNLSLNGDGSSERTAPPRPRLPDLAPRRAAALPKQSVCAALKAVAEYASLATPARWEETVRGLLAAPHLPLVEVYSAARKT